MPASHKITTTQWQRIHYNSIVNKLKLILIGGVSRKSGQSMLGKAALGKQHVGNRRFHKRGSLWTLQSLKISTFLDNKYLHSAWVSDAANFCCGWMVMVGSIRWKQLPMFISVYLNSPGFGIASPTCLTIFKAALDEGLLHICTKPYFQSLYHEHELLGKTQNGTYFLSDASFYIVKTAEL